MHATAGTWPGGDDGDGNNDDGGGGGGEGGGGDVGAGPTARLFVVFEEGPVLRFRAPLRAAKRNAAGGKWFDGVWPSGL